MREGYLACGMPTKCAPGTPHINYFPYVMQNLPALSVMITVLYCNCNWQIFDGVFQQSSETVPAVFSGYRLEDARTKAPLEPSHGPCLAVLFHSFSVPNCDLIAIEPFSGRGPLYIPRRLSTEARQNCINMPGSAVVDLQNNFGAMFIGLIVSAV